MLRIEESMLFKGMNSNRYGQVLLVNVVVG